MSNEFVSNEVTGNEDFTLAYFLKRNNEICCNDRVVLDFLPDVAAKGNSKSLLLTLRRV